MVSTGNIHNNHLIELFSQNLGKLCELIESNQIIELSTQSITIHA